MAWCVMQNPSAFSPPLLCLDPLESCPAGPQVCPAKGHVTGGDGHLGNARAQGSPSRRPSLPPCFYHPLLHRPGSHTGSGTWQLGNISRETIWGWFWFWKIWTQLKLVQMHIWCPSDCFSVGQIQFGHHVISPISLTYVQHLVTRQNLGSNTIWGSLCNNLFDSS